ncbi:ribonuclease H family protein, partial [Acidomonas methanolica]
MDNAYRLALEWGIQFQELFDPLATLIAVDASADHERASYAGIIVHFRDGETKISTIGQVTRILTGPAYPELWAVNCAIRCARRDRHLPARKIIFTDCQHALACEMRVHEEIRWVSRRTPIIKRLHVEANRMRKSLPLMTPSSYRAVERQKDMAGQERGSKDVAI